MCCFALIIMGLGPRIAVAVWWIFGDRVDRAFDSWVLPLLGLIFLPWTTLAYLIVWSPVGGASGADWILIVIGVFADIASYAARGAKGRTSYY
jgi:hypothetical protein